MLLNSETQEVLWISKFKFHEFFYVTVPFNYFCVTLHLYE